MTVRELYEWAKSHDTLDYDIAILDSDGCLTQSYLCDIEIRSNTQEIIL